MIEHLGGNARREVTGRGVSVSTDPMKIFAVLLRVFGDGDSLPQIQQQFYSYKQREGEDLVACSLELVKLFDRITQLDPSFLPGRDSQLKNRLAEAVIKDSLRTKLRRLNEDHPDLSFFDTRDHVLRLIASKDSPKTTTPNKDKQETTVNEVSHDIHKILREQGQQLLAQQNQIESLLAALNTSNTPRVGGTRRCWICDSTEHLKKNCPNNTRSGGSSAAPQAQSQEKLNK